MPAASFPPWPWRHFSYAEMACRCGCARAPLDAEFMARLSDLREQLGFALPVTSGYRCARHNASVSKTGAHGPHTTGRAVDVRIWGERAFALIATAPGHGFTGIGIQQQGDWPARYIHLDDLTGPQRPWIWSYA